MYLRLRGVAGHALDIYEVARLNFVNPHSYTKFRVINRIRKHTTSHVFVEAGTYLGVTADRCSRVFSKVYTIELDEALAARAATCFSSRRNLKVIRGDALKVLPPLMQEDGVHSALVFLDSHFCGAGTARGALTEPAVEELEILSEHMRKINAIIVDDFRCFGTEQGFPEKSTLLKTAEDLFARNNFAVSVQLDQLIIARRS